MTLSRLEDAPFGLREWEIVARDRPAVELDASLVDHAPPVAGGFPKPACQERRQVHGVVRDAHFLDVVWCLVLAHDPREVALPAPRAFLAVPAADDPPRELELPLHRVVGMRTVVDQ